MTARAPEARHLNSPYPARRGRAIELMGERLEAEEILALLILVMEHQAPWFTRASERGWSKLHAAKAESGAPGFVPDRLPLDTLARGLRAFVEEVSSASTEVLGAVGTRLRRDGEEGLARLLTDWAAGRSLDDHAIRLGVGVDPLVFFARAFLQPVAEAVVGRAAVNDAPGASCPGCSRAPLLSTFRDKPGRLGGRHLVCGFCATEWAFPRAACPHCDERSSDELVHHSTDALPHVRVDECRSCGRYMKGIDLRKDGRAVPVVDEAATVELDLWARERGMVKVQTNVVGL